MQMRVERKLSWGNIFSMATTVISIIVAAGIAWGTLSNRVSATEDQIKSIKQEVKDIKKDVEGINQNTARMDERMKGMEKNIDELTKIAKEWNKK